MEPSSRSNDKLLRQGRTITQTWMAQIYGWMTCGLLLTAFVSFYALRTPRLMGAIFSSRLAFFGLIIVQLGVVIALSALIRRISAALATGLFMLYSALTGLTMSAIFLAYTSSSIASTFVVTAGTFAVMSLWGYTTKRDLTRFGSMLFMGLIGIVLASLVNFWLKSPTLTWVITYIGVLVFVGLTAYDTQRLKQMGAELDAQDSSKIRRYAISGALTLYLDFINLFLMLLRVMGDRR